MDKHEIYTIQAMINEYGCRAVLNGFITALRQSADQMSDMGLKERALAQAAMADILRDVDISLD